MKNARQKKSMRGYRGTLLVLAAALFFLFPARESRAGVCPCYDLTPQGTGGLAMPVICCSFIPLGPVSGAYEAYTKYWIKDWYLNNIRPYIKHITGDASLIGVYQVFSVGTFFDGRQQLQTQRLLQRLAAQASKDYQPSLEICTIGTTARFMAGANGKGHAMASILAKRSLDRELGYVSAGASEGAIADRALRLKEFKARYCNKDDDNGSFSVLCDANIPADHLNKDINYTRTIESAWTIDEKDIWALGNNLYAHDLFSPRPTRKQMQNKGMQELYMDMRALTAKRSVAENSFYAIVGLKAPGTSLAEQGRPYMEAILGGMGLPESKIYADEVLGKAPSYYAQLELLTQKLYQDPRFITNLYDKPANVTRKEVAMQGMELMLDREMYESDLRYEMLLAVMLETQLVKEQERVHGRIRDIRKRGKEN